MCGIFGIIKNIGIDSSNSNVPLLILQALNLLKNRGYDSCGIYSYGINDIGNVEFIEKFGVDGEYITTSIITDIFEIMEEKINNIDKPEELILGIGHTRWATHGGKTDYNSHPHISNSGKIKIVHNGIISNFNDIKQTQLKDFIFHSSTDTEVIANLIEYYKLKTNYSMIEIIREIQNVLVGTWACIIFDSDEPGKLYFMKNENPLLIGKNNNFTMFTSEPSGFMNMIDEYYLLRDKSYGYVDLNNNVNIYGKYNKINLIKSSDDDIVLSPQYKHWMYKEILDQCNLDVLREPILNKLRYNQENILFNFDFIKPCKYLYIIACGSSYYAGLIASNYFRYTKAFEFVNVFDGGEFSKIHLDSIENPEQNLLVLLISQSGETRDLNIATTICREYSSNRKNILEPNKLLSSVDSLLNLSELNNNDNNNNNNGEIKIIGIINVIGSLISRRTIDNIYTNCGRENAVASTKSCTSQIIACLLLAIYKSDIGNKLIPELKNKFMFDLNKLEEDITNLIHYQNKISNIANLILSKGKKNMFLLGKDELHGVALEGALKIKEVAYIHAEGFNISALKHGPYAMIEKDTPIIIIYKERDHFVKSIIEEIKTRGAYVIEISSNADVNDESSILLPQNRTFTGILAVVALQLLSYYLSIGQNINPDRPRNLAKVVTVD